jgi:hypothetical protein
MRYGTLVGGITALAIGAPALAENPTQLHPNLAQSVVAPDVVAQAYPAPPPYPPAPSPSYPPGSHPAYPSADTPPAPPPPASPSAALAPNPPPPPEAESPPPAPSSTYVWQPGHWYWNGVQFHWQPGSYVAKPTATASYEPGHWEQRPDGWLWVGGHWNYRTQAEGG